ncbi:hypothetical protein D3C79_632050 [compost metagenome]
MFAAGMTCKALTLVLLTVTLVLAVTPSRLAESVVEPAATPVMSPVLSTVATAVLLLNQATWEETSCTVLSAKVAMAVSLVLVPMASCTVAGVIWIWLMVRLTAETLVWPVMPCRVALTMALPRLTAVILP